MNATHSNNNAWRGHTAVILANTFFGLGVPVSKILLDQWVTPNGYLASRSLGAAIIFWIVSLFVKREKVSARDLAIIIFGGILGFVVSQLLTAWALVYTSPVYFSLIATLTPIATLLLAALLLSERITPLKTLGVLLGIAGAVLMVLVGDAPGEASNNALGIALALGSLITWALYLIATRKVAAKYSPVTQMKWVFLVSSIITVPLALHEWPAQKLYTSAADWQGISAMAYIVVFCTFVGFFLIPYAMKYLRATTVSIYTNLQPVVASLVAIYLGQDVLSWDKLAAAILVFLSAYIVTVATVKKENNAADDGR